jgi:hypothetical protein
VTHHGGARGRMAAWLLSSQAVTERAGACVESSCQESNAMRPPDLGRASHAARERFHGPPAA